MPHARNIALLALSLCASLSARAGDLMDLWQAALGAGARYGTFEHSTSGARFAGPGFGSHDGVSFDTRNADALGYGWSLGVQHRFYSAARDAAARRLTTQATLGGVATDSARQALMLQVTQAYFDLLAAADQVETLEKLRQATREAHDRAQARFDTGDAQIIEADLLVARNDVLVSRGRLQDMTGVNEVYVRRPSIAADDPIAGEDALAEWRQRAGEHSPRQTAPARDRGRRGRCRAFARGGIADRGCVCARRGRSTHERRLRHGCGAHSIRSRDRPRAHGASRAGRGTRDRAALGRGEMGRSAHRL